MIRTKPHGKRRDFLGIAATAAAASISAVVPMGGAVAAAATVDSSTDFERWLDTIRGTYKQLYDMPELNEGMGLAWSWAFFATGAPAYGVPENDLSVVLVLRHNSIALALADPMWAKYRLGEMFRIEDPDTKAPAVRNPYYSKPGALPIPDASLQKLIARGVKVAACNLAITFYSAEVAQNMSLKPEDVKREWMQAVHPGIQIVPSGVVACNGAVSRGCIYIYAG